MLVDEKMRDIPVRIVRIAPSLHEIARMRSRSAVPLRALLYTISLLGNYPILEGYEYTITGIWNYMSMTFLMQ